jgi:predicted ATPase/class 3 adenylate cyclase
MTAIGLPAGTVTFLFTDIEGSTRLWQQHPRAMKDALARHHAILQHAIDSSGGYVFQIVGDAFCAAFPTATSGVAAATAAQRALAGEAWKESCPIRVRMAIHTGAAEVHPGEHRSGEYVSGLTLSHASRLLSVAHGGQILVSSATREMLRDGMSERVEFRDLGRHRLRDIADAAHIFQVTLADLPGNFPPLRSLDTVPNNLPRQLTSFIGRRSEMAEVKRLLSETRLLTLAGPGGGGKTRLSLEVAGDVLPAYPDGAWLVELAPVAAPALAPQVLATTLGVREEPGREILHTLSDYLASRRALLVLDNCEHLLDACARLADGLLRSCPDITVLASSREPLAVAGEVTFRVPSLSAPDPVRSLALDRLAGYDAVRLFVDRAAAARPGFALTDTNAAAVAQICQRLDGIPLAIELAAARMRTLSVQQIAARLDERFRLLTGGSRTALPRHQTLRGLIDWSHELLGEAERAVFRRLSVFVGGWSLEASERVVAGDGVAPSEVVDLLGRLIDKSLLLMEEHDGEVRYDVLETIRQYASEKLAETGEGETVRARHSDIMVDLAERTELGLQGPEQAAALTQLETDHDNLRAALRCSIDGGDAETALRLASALWPFWDTRGYVREGREWLDQALELARAQSPAAVTWVGRRALARALDGAAFLRGRWSDFSAMVTLQTEALAVWRELGDKRGIAEALNNLGDRTRQLGNRSGARALVEESLGLFQEVSDARGIAHALNNLGEILVEDGEHTRARALFEQSVPIFEAIEDGRGLAHALDNLAGILTAQGDPIAAEPLYTRSLELAKALGDWHASATALRGLGDVAHRRHDRVRARRLYEDCIARFREMKDAFCLARSLIACALTLHADGLHERADILEDEALGLLRASDAKGELAARLEQLGRVALEHGNVDRAARYLVDSVALAAETQDVAAVASGLSQLARVAVARGRPLTDARLQAAADAWRRAHGLGGAGAPTVAAAGGPPAHGVDADALLAAWAEGTAMTLDQAIAAGRELLG